MMSFNPDELEYCPQCGGGLTGTGICFTCQVVWERADSLPPTPPPPPVHSAPNLKAPRCPWCLAPLDPRGHCWNCLVVWAEGYLQGSPYVAPGAQARSGAAGRPAAAPPRQPVVPRKPPSKLQKHYRRFLSYIPPARLIWIFLGILIYEVGGFSSVDSASAVLGILVLAVVADLFAQYTRFVRLRIPDAAIAMGMFLALLVEPPYFSLELATIVLLTILFRHLVRQNGRPWLNPTALGLTIAFFLWGTAVPWNVGGPDPSGYPSTSEIVMIAFGIGLILRQKSSWVMPAAFFATVIPLLIISPVFVGGKIVLSTFSFLTTVLSPLILFFGFYMVPEPRTSPGGKKRMMIYAIVVAVASVVIPILLYEVPAYGALGSVAPFLALFVGNLYAVAVRHSGTGPTVARKTTSSASRQPRYVGAVISSYQGSYYQTSRSP